jgi:hypothetical protein
VGAWKLRAIVYGMLAVVAALVLWQSGALADGPKQPHVLEGWTDQGQTIQVVVLDGRVVDFDASHVGSRCGAGRWWSVRWYPSSAQGNVSYRQDGTAFWLHERPAAGYGESLAARVNAYMHGTVAGHDEAVSGSLWYTAAPSGIPCASGTVRFSATR